jgi:hypothetical protein
MHNESDRGFARRLADLIGCLLRGHAWQTTEITLGKSSLLSTDCARCGQVGPVHGTPRRRRPTTPATRRLSG